MDNVAVLAMLGVDGMKDLMEMKLRWLFAAFRTVGTSADAKQLIASRLRGGGCPLL